LTGVCGGVKSEYQERQDYQDKDYCKQGICTMFECNHYQAIIRYWNGAAAWILRKTVLNFGRKA
jgi:hypothetical protein